MGCMGLRLRRSSTLAAALAVVLAASAIQLGGYGEIPAGAVIRWQDFDYMVLRQVVTHGRCGIGEASYGMQWYEVCGAGTSMWRGIELRESSWRYAQAWRMGVH